MKTEHVLSIWKEELIAKMENINDYENQLLIGFFVILKNKKYKFGFF